MESSEEVTAFLAVTDYQGLTPLLAAAASSKDVLESELMFKGVLSDLVEDIKKKEANKFKAQAETKVDEVKELTAVISTLKENWSREKSTLLKADFFLSYTLLHATSGDPNVMVRRIMGASNSDSGAVTGLEMWRQMTHQFAGIIKTQDSFMAQADHVACRVEC